MSKLEPPRTWTGTWLVVDRSGDLIDASLPWSMGPEAWLDADSMATFRTCLDLQWAGLSDVRFHLVDGHVVAFAAEEEVRGWRLTCFDATGRHRVHESEQQTDRIRVLTDFAGAVARELVDPMSIVQAKIELMLDLAISDPKIMRRHLEIALQHAERVSSVLDNLRQVSQPGLLAPERWSVSALAENVLELLGMPIRPKVQLQVESGLFASGPQAMVVRIVASLVRYVLQHRREAFLAARTHRGHPTVVVGPTPQARGRPVAVPATLAGQEPLVWHFGGSLEAHADGEDEWLVLQLPRPPLSRARRATQAVQLLVLGSPPFQRDVELRLRPQGFAFQMLNHRLDAVEVLTTSDVDLALIDLDLEGPGPRGHALAIDLAPRFPKVEWFVAVPANTKPLPMGTVRFVRWPEDSNDLVRAARGDG
ncbi:MAG: hypothetical protein AAGA48_06645 [Myxococcota bacterium]